MSKSSFLSDEEYLAQEEARIAAAQQAGLSGGVPYAAAMFGGQQKQNLVEWQLDFKPELESIEHLLRNDEYKKGKDGEYDWYPNSNQENVPMNDIGVNDVLKQIVLLVNKNKVLSNYDEKQINARVRAICHAMRELIYLNYEKYGMDNEYKWNCYYSIVVSLNDLIESAYRRALNGEERRDLNQARMVNQNDPVMQPGMGIYNQISMPQKKSGSKIWPWNWGR